jgi:S1-C subfamily serine protease
MKTIFLSMILTTCTLLSSYAQLDPKLVASKYGRGVVKIVLFDAELEKVKPGWGYLGRGSGFFVTRDGYIFTNRHVVEKCVKGYIDYDYKSENGEIKAGLATYSDEVITSPAFVKAHHTGYTVPLVQVFHGPTEQDYKLYGAEVVSIGMGSFDGALLKIVRDEQGATANFNFTALPIGDSDRLAQGEQLCVFGYPQQVSGSADIMLRDLSTLSLGIMSGYDGVINNDYGFIKTDAEIHPGNSGGPVFNEENKVIGIATAKGVATGIGLVGGINGMYYISASNASAHQTLMSAGLRAPQRSVTINTSTGARLPIKSVSEINNNFNSPGGGYVSDSPTSSTDPYAGSKVYFSNISITQNNNHLPASHQQYTKFTIDRKNGGIIWVYIDTYPAQLNTSRILVLIDKKKGTEFQKYEDKAFDVTGSLDYTYFSQSFYDKGTYRFTIYSKEMKFINSGTIDISYQ